MGELSLSSDTPLSMPFTVMLLDQCRPSVSVDLRAPGLHVKAVLGGILICFTFSTAILVMSLQSLFATN